MRTFPWLQTSETGYGTLTYVSISPKIEVPAVIKWVPRDNGVASVRHGPPKGETHIVTVISGELTVRWIGQEGHRQVNLGPTCQFKEMAFSDWLFDGEGENGKSGHISSATQPGTVLMVVMIKPGEKLPFQPIPGK